MIKTTYVTSSNTFGGLIYQADFCTDYEGTRNIASRIESDMKKDKEWAKAALNNRRKKNYVKH